MANTDVPKPTTAIPELASMELRDDDFQAVVAAVNAVDSLMVSMLAPRGASLRCRIELAAAVLLGAIDHGHAAAVETSAMDPEAVDGARCRSGRAPCHGDLGAGRRVRARA